MMGARDDQHKEDRAMMHRARGILVSMALFAIVTASLPQTGHTQQAQALPPIIAGNATPIENATNLKAQPLAVLAKFPEAGPAMARYVAEQLTQQPAIVDALLSIVNDTSPAQASAMGAGMVRAVRALGTKQAASARAITEKVMRTDNKYLTTTFSSLGPYYRGNAVFTAPPNAPPRAAFAGSDMGAAIGAAWRVGPAENENFTARTASGNAGDVLPKCLYNTNVNIQERCHGMIVALINSDASSNGAVSTSPTI